PASTAGTRAHAAPAADGHSRAADEYASAVSDKKTKADEDTDAIGPADHPHRRTDPSAGNHRG
ncbi:MAG: hypothetical protein J4N68_04990, partial [Chloroflexi bacterium]|nr:hypothetical protein [Chloroflexota bacterium]